MRTRLLLCAANMILICMVLLTTSAHLDGQQSNFQSTASQAIIPHLIKFNGLLRDLSGKPLFGPVDVTFSLYAGEAGGNPLWFETQIIQADGNGSYSVLLGAMTPTGVPTEIFTSGEAHWLGVQVSNLPEQSRILLVSVPYAIKAGDAETLGGKPASAFMLAGSSSGTASSLTNLISSGPTKTTSSTQSPITNTITASYIPVYTDSLGTTGNSIIFQSGTKIGINTNAPAFNLDLNGAVFMVGTKTAAPGLGGTMRFRDDTGTQRWLFGIPGSAGSQDFQMYNYSNGHAPLFIQNGAASYSLYLAGTGNVGIGTTTPGQKLSVVGMIESTTGGFKFPDGTTQTSAATSGGAVVSSFNGRTGAVVSATNDYAFSQISGSVGGTQLSGPYSNALTLSNASNSFTGDGSGLTNLTGANVTGTVPSATSASSATNASGLSCTGCVTGAMLGTGTVTGSNLAGGTITGTNVSTSAGINPTAISGTAATLGSNAFVGDQMITGGLTVTTDESVSGNLSIAGTINGWQLVPYASSSCNVFGTIGTCVSGNTLSGYTGFAGKSIAIVRAANGQIINSAVVGANTITTGVIGGTIAGGGGTFDGTDYANTVDNDFGTVGGGSANHAGDGSGPTSSGCCQSIGGGYGNSATGTFATIAGGRQNIGAADYAVISGGLSNNVTGIYDVIAGGTNNTAYDYASSVGGGSLNVAGSSAVGNDGEYATVAGGYTNHATGPESTVSGGQQNHATGQYATVAGGSGNTASGNKSTVAGGASNVAAGNNSFAAGVNANAAFHGDFVWVDDSVISNAVSATAADQFVVRSAGGVWFGTGSTVSFPGGSFIATDTGAYLTTGGTWTNASDRNLKANFRPVDVRKLLVALDSIPITTWNYKAEDPSMRHMGPMAQDFYAALHLGPDDKHITTVDEGGVALAGVQALYKLSLKKDEEIRSLVEQNRKLTKEIDQLRKQAAMIAELEAHLNQDEAEQKRMHKELARLTQNHKKQRSPELAHLKF